MHHFRLAGVESHRRSAVCLHERRMPHDYSVGKSIPQAKANRYPGEWEPQPHQRTVNDTVETPFNGQTKLLKIQFLQLKCMPKPFRTCNDRVVLLQTTNYPQPGFCEDNVFRKTVLLTVAAIVVFLSTT